MLLLVAGVRAENLKGTVNRVYANEAAPSEKEREPRGEARLSHLNAIYGEKPRTSSINL
jgi:hypothetical protein